MSTNLLLSFECLDALAVPPCQLFGSLQAASSPLLPSPSLCFRFRFTIRALQKFYGPEVAKICKHIYSDNSEEIRAACEHFDLSRDTSAAHRSETNGIAENVIRRVKEEQHVHYLNQVYAMHGGRKLWSVIASWKMWLIYFGPTKPPTA